MKCDRTATQKICFFNDHREPLYLCANHLKKIQKKEPDVIEIPATFRHQCQVEQYKPLKVEEKVL